MAVTSSSMLELGTTAPLFSLRDTEGATVCLDDFWESPALLVMFICNHCPFVRHLRGGIVELAREYGPRGAAVVAINANDAERYPQDGPEAMRREKEEVGYPFPYLFDETQSVARAYRAACTPDFFVFDRDRRLTYRGRFDASRPGNGVPVTGADVRAALEAVLEGRPAPAEQHPSVGCGIKWKPEGAPDARG